MSRPADRRPGVGDLFPDTAAIQAALEHLTRTALLRRLGPATSDAPLLAVATAEERTRTRGIGFGVDLVRSILAGRKTQTRRLIRPQPDTPPPASSCPVARVGELLHVREPWLKTDDRTLYAADEPPGSRRRFKPGMYMPRNLARLWLRVTAIRVERAQAITTEDLKAEGLPAGASFPQVWNGFYSTAGQRYEDDPWVWVIGFSPEPRRTN